MTPEKRLVYEETVAAKARKLVTRVVLPGEWYLVRWGGTRKGAGTFYTRPGLAVPTVQRSLRPLAFDPPMDSEGKPDREAPASAWTPKKPEEILSLKICDPACGSGTFPVAALRFLTEALYKALHHHNRLYGDPGRSLKEILGVAQSEKIEDDIKEDHLPCRPEDDEFERRTKAVLLRYIVERCIYGVDLDPLAVELCRLSLWIETMDRELPFSFLDHKIKCGNSLVGAWFDQFQHYPVMAWKNREGGDKNHTNGVHFKKEQRSKAIKAFVKDRLTPDLQVVLSGRTLFHEDLQEQAASVHTEALTALSRLHVGGSDDEDLEDHGRTASLYFCRHCGAAHPQQVARCLHCGATGETVTLYTVRQRKDNPGVLTSCLSCGAIGRRIGTQYREPARPVRATNVADVHVLVQDMVHHADRPRLLVFCDNRQDAAFQAGWMKDHARRFRLRALMAEALKKGPQSVGDLAHNIDDELEQDEALSRALVPEVWQVVRKEGSGGRHELERRKFLRIQVLREVTLSSRQSIGLEPWGRMKVDYEGLNSTLSWIQENANALAMPAEDLRDGVAGLLDYLRRKRVLYDPEREIFTKYWMDGDLEVQQGYLPQIGNPVGTKLRREPTEKNELVTQWISDRGDTTMRQIARKWGIDPDDTEDFLESLFRLLVDQHLFIPVRLKGSRGNPLPNVSEVYQVNADLLRLQQNHGVWRCKNCRRRTIRRTPRQACLAWRCDGELEFVSEDPDNYDLQLLDQGYSMLRPEEHTAMVPHEERERLENLFKGEGDALNAFVCTPTLELGVDIGKLDAVMMRNVPPLPANYWQRAGRAGRRFRMAVDLTYCRPVSHDRAYFTEPLKLLAGRVDPPAFNLRNDLTPYALNIGRHRLALILQSEFKKFTMKEEANFNETIIQEPSLYLDTDGIGFCLMEFDSNKRL
jgi:hypothetical protein